MYVPRYFYSPTIVDAKLSNYVYTDLIFFSCKTKSKPLFSDVKVYLILA